MKKQNIKSIVFILLAVLFFGFCIASPFIGMAVNTGASSAYAEEVQPQADEDISVVYLPTTSSVSMPRSLGYTRKSYKYVGFDITTTALRVGIAFPRSQWAGPNYTILNTDELSTVGYDIAFILKEPVPTGGKYYRFGVSLFNGGEGDNMLSWQGYLPEGQQYIQTHFEFILPVGVASSPNDMYSSTHFVFFDGTNEGTDTFLVGTQLSVYYAALTFTTSATVNPKKERLIILDELDLFNQLKAANTQYQNGYNAGKTDGYDDGYSVGKEEGTQEGYNNGYSVGHSAGYNLGLSSGTSPLTLFIQPAQDFMNMKLFGTFSLADAFGIVLTVLMATIFIKLFAGG